MLSNECLNIYFCYKHGQVMVVRRGDFFGLISTAPVEAKTLEHTLTTQFPCTHFTAVYIRHPQTKLEPLVYTTECRRRIVPSDGMHRLSDLDVTACFS